MLLRGNVPALRAACTQQGQLLGAGQKEWVARSLLGSRGRSGTGPLGTQAVLEQK